MTVTRRGLIAQAAVLPFALSGAARAATPEPLWDGVQSAVGMDFDAQGNLFVAEWGPGRISRFNTDGTRDMFATGLPGPSGLAVGPDGGIFVASYSTDVIWRFSTDGTRSTHVTGLATPAGVGFDRSGRLMVANRRTNEVLVVENGQLVPLIGGLNTPVGAVQTPDGGFVVSNIGGGVTILRPDGTRIEAGQDFRTPGPGVAITRTGRVFVADYGGTTVREILMDGGSKAVADGLESPVGLVVAPDQTSLLTATWGQDAIFRVPMPG